MPDHPRALYASPKVHIDATESLSETGVTVTLNLPVGSPALEGHFPHFPIFPGVFSVELARQAGIEYCKAYFPNARLAHISARFVAPVLPPCVLRCECKSKRSEPNQVTLTATCSVDSVVCAVVKLKYDAGQHA